MNFRDKLPESLSPKHIQQILGIGRRQTYELLSEPPFRVIRLGRKYIIPKHLFFKWFDGETSEG